jgi:hypothetical protein
MVNPIFIIIFISLWSNNSSSIKKSKFNAAVLTDDVTELFLIYKQLKAYGLALVREF